jgi:hypothetical protein
MDAGDVQPGDTESPAIDPSADDDVPAPDTDVVADAGNHHAMNAIGCVLGLDAHSPDGPKTGQCDATCP